MLTRIFLGALMVAVTCPAWADIKVFTSRAEFEAAIQPGYLFENFDNLIADVFQEPSMRLEQQGFVATITASNDTLLYSGNGDLSINDREEAMVITFSGEAVTAVGARFFPEYFDGTCMAGKMIITVDNGEPPIELPRSSDCENEFFGFATDGSAIAEIRIETDRSTDETKYNFPTVDDLYVGRKFDGARRMLTVAVDIKPGDFPNVINPNSKGVIPVAILTTDTFEASWVNPASVTFGATGVEAHALKATMVDLDMDGRPDMLLHFRTEQAGIKCGNTLLNLQGLTQEKAEPFSGTDSIRTVPCK